MMNELLSVLGWSYVHSNKRRDENGGKDDNDDGGIAVLYAMDEWNEPKEFKKKKQNKTEDGFDPFCIHGYNAWEW